MGSKSALKTFDVHSVNISYCNVKGLLSSIKIEKVKKKLIHIFLIAATNKRNLCQDVIGSKSSRSSYLAIQL